MLPLTKQIQIASDNAKGAAARLVGRSHPLDVASEMALGEELGHDPLLQAGAAAIEAPLSTFQGLKLRRLLLGADILALLDALADTAGK